MKTTKEIATQIIEAARSQGGFLNRFPIDEDYETLNWEKKCEVNELLEQRGEITYSALGNLTTFSLIRGTSFIDRNGHLLDSK